MGTRSPRRIPRAFCLTAAAVLLGMLWSGCQQKPTIPLYQLLVPTVRIEQNHVKLDGKIAGSTIIIEDLGRLQKLDELFNALQSRRHAFRTVLPHTDVPNLLILECEEHTPALVFKSVFQTSAVAGYTHQLVHTSAERGVDVEASLPSVPIFGRQPPENPPEVLHLHLNEGKVTGVRKRGKKVVNEWSLSHGRDELPADLAKQLTTGLTKKPLQNPRPEVVLHCDNRQPFKLLAKAFETLQDVRAKLPQRTGKRPAFSIVFSMR